MSSRLNLEDIARLAGVSRSTVSRVINNHPYVRDDTRHKVLQVIRENNFRPNLAARALVTQQTRVLSLVIPQAVATTFIDPYFSILIQSIMVRAGQHDYAVMLWVGDGTEEQGRFCDRILNNSFFDGVLITTTVDNDPLIPRLVQAGFPFVVIGPPSREDLNYLDVDNLRGAQMAVAHLLRLGRERIGMITGPLKLLAARDRLRAYRLALERDGRPIDSDLIVEGNYTENSGYQGMKTLLRHQVDAVFAANDMMALGAIRAIQESGLRVPDDISVVGFDDLPNASAANPPLTTVRQPVERLGELAIQALIDLCSGILETPYQAVLPVELVVRETCGATHV